MYVATTRFQIIVGQELLFETTWRERESYLTTMKGYRGLLLLRGAKEVDHTVYFSQFIWNSKEDFENWTTSDAFIKAHIQFGDTSILFHKKPVFEDFEVILQESATKAK
jgi:heme-degrading monooxygenase HmoA